MRLAFLQQDYIYKMDKFCRLVNEFIGSVAYLIAM